MHFKISSLRIAKKELDALRIFLEGGDILKSSLKPRLKDIMEAEREAWRYIATRLNADNPDAGKPRTPKDEIVRIGYTNFWNRSVLCITNVTGKSDDTPDTKKPWQPWNPKGW